MKVTQVKLWLIDEPKLKAGADIVLDDVLKIRGIKLIQGQDGFFIDFPSQRRKLKCYGCGGRNPMNAVYCSWCGMAQASTSPWWERDERMYVVYPIHHPLRVTITEAIVDEYRRQTGNV